MFRLFKFRAANYNGSNNCFVVAYVTKLQVQRHGGIIEDTIDPFDFD